MNLKPAAIALAIFGQALIALCFFYFFNLLQLLGTATCVLDFVVVSLIFWLWATTFVVHPIALDDPSGKQAAGLGLKWGSITLYSIFAGAVVVFGIVSASMNEPFAFKYQLLTQAILIFILLVMFFLSAYTTSFAGKVYSDQQQQMQGHADIRTAIAELAEASMLHDVPAELRERLSTLKGETRFIAPSSSAEARALDKTIEKEASEIRYALSDYKLNAENIDRLLTDLERHLTQRKQTY